MSLDSIVQAAAAIKTFGRITTAFATAFVNDIRIERNSRKLRRLNISLRITAYFQYDNYVLLHNIQSVILVSIFIKKPDILDLRLYYLFLKRRHSHFD